MVHNTVHGIVLRSTLGQLVPTGLSRMLVRRRTKACYTRRECPWAPPRDPAVAASAQGARIFRITAVVASRDPAEAGIAFGTRYAFYFFRNWIIC